jgi:hypothetical protein
VVARVRHLHLGQEAGHHTPVRALHYWLDRNLETQTVYETSQSRALLRKLELSAELPDVCAGCRLQSVQGAQPS